MSVCCWNRNREKLKEREQKKGNDNIFETAVPGTAGFVRKRTFSKLVNPQTGCCRSPRAALLADRGTISRAAGGCVGAAPAHEPRAYGKVEQI